MESHVGVFRTPQTDSPNYRKSGRRSLSIATIPASVVPRARPAVLPEDGVSAASAFAEAVPMGSTVLKLPDAIN